jgi:tRNA-splicing ligase RtcB
MFEVIDAGNGRFIKAWKKGVRFEDKAIEQLKNTAQLPFIFKWIGAMPDTHWGMGSTVGTVLPTKGAVVPAAVGVDIGCGMLAIRTDLNRAGLGDLAVVRKLIEGAVPAGRSHNGGPGDIGAWPTLPSEVRAVWNEEFGLKYEALCDKHPGARAKNTVNQLGTLGTGNHFIELAEDEQGAVWIVLHSGSRGLGNKIGQYFTNVAKELCAKWFINLPDPDLAYLPQDTQEFNDYKDAVTLAQKFAWENRLLMLRNIIYALGHIQTTGVQETVHCHHNYISWENHFNENVIVTRKGAVRARKGDMGIIPGSMGARTYIVRGLGNPNSFCSCSHGAGRSMSRTEAVRRFSIEDHLKATEGVECLKDASVLDETPGAYKDIEAVMAAQSDLVEPVYRLKQFICVKGASDKTHV